MLILPLEKIPLVDRIELITFVRVYLRVPLIFFIDSVTNLILLLTNPSLLCVHVLDVNILLCDVTPFYKEFLFLNDLLLLSLLINESVIKHLQKKRRQHFFSFFLFITWEG